MIAVDSPLKRSLPEHQDKEFPAVFAALGGHVRACERARSGAFTLQCLAEQVHEVLGPRMVTTVMAATALMALLALID